MKRFILGALLLSAIATRQGDAATQATARQQPGAEIALYAPEQHDLYDGRFVLRASSIHQVGRLGEPPGWNHMGNDGSNVEAVQGTVEIDVNEKDNTGTFVARLRVPEGNLVIEGLRFHEFSPCQDGGIAAYLYEHGDSGCGDTNWPKTFIWVAGWGFAKANLDEKPLYDDYQYHFMVTQGIRDRKTLKVNYPLLDKKSPAGAVNPAAMQLDFYIRSPETDDRNNPTRKVFDHFFAMEVTWK
ncbi:MAG TPA: hypothetical protein VLK65_04725 [Vicinamibacteria bacterium]|nr:hypothetical protein [Vicinamibacteria bacterium]